MFGAYLIFEMMIVLGKFNFKKKFKNEDYLRMAMLIYVDWLNICYYFSNFCGINEMNVLNHEQNEAARQNNNINGNVRNNNARNGNARNSNARNNNTHTSGLKSSNYIIREN